MADAADLKSVVRKDVRVRLPPSAPALILRFSRRTRLYRLTNSEAFYSTRK